MKPFKYFPSNLVVYISLALLGPTLRADVAPYYDVYSCKAESSSLVAEHHHDWSPKARFPGWKTPKSYKDIFSSANTYSALVVIDRTTKRQLFKTPAPALRNLWISPDSKFIVGISNVKFCNPVQIVVFNNRGKRLLTQKIGWSSFKSVIESPTNWVHWYKEPNPRISINETKGWIHLQTEGENGEQRNFKFRNSI